MESVKCSYELVVVLSLNQTEDSMKELIIKFKDLIEKNATLNKIDEWGKRTLAYEIKKEKTGYYVLFDFTSCTSFVAELERVLNITDGLLRHLIVRKTS